MPQAKSELTVWIGGAAGDGIASAGESFAKTCSRSGYHVFAHNSYQSVIRGGHVCLHIRVGTHKVLTPGDNCNYLIALNLDTFKRYAPKVTSGGAIFFNTDKFKAPEVSLNKDVQVIGVPVMELMGNQLMQNTMLMGALQQVLELDHTEMLGIIKERFTKKGDAVVQANVDAFNKGAEIVKKNHKPGSVKLGRGDGKRRPLAGGNPMMGLGAVAAGCKFYAAYPMTPATSVLHWMVKYGPKNGVMVKQCEDEISVINMAIGAAHVGVRSMCASSGGGFALMTEAIGEAGMTETPVVIINVSRGGPSTGLPTKTEQADLFQMIGASQGDYPRAILAPRTVPECYDAAIQAHNLAEKYQCPVIILSDLYLSERLETFDGVDIGNVPIDRGKLGSSANGEIYRRFLDTEDGISPRLLPGTPDARYTAATDEHDEDGIVISDVFSNPKVRVKMMEKRMRKMETMEKELEDPVLEGPNGADLTLVGYGSTYQVMTEAMNTLNAEGFKVNLLCPKVLWPFPAKAVSKLLGSCKTTLAVEANFTGQYARYIRMETGLDLKHHLRKYDGEPFEPKQVIDQAREILKRKPSKSIIASVVSDEGVPEDFSPIGQPPSSAEVMRAR